MHLSDLFWNFRKGIALATMRVFVENVAWIAEPTLFGRVIDALIEKATAPTHLVPHGAGTG